jgi:hypothetical protein
LDWIDKKKDGTKVFQLVNPDIAQIRLLRDKELKGDFFLEGARLTPDESDNFPHLIHDIAYVTGKYIPIKDFNPSSA